MRFRARRRRAHGQVVPLPDRSRSLIDVHSLNPLCDDLFTDLGWRLNKVDGGGYGMLAYSPQSGPQAYSLALHISYSVQQLHRCSPCQGLSQSLLRRPSDVSILKLA